MFALAATQSVHSSWPRTVRHSKPWRSASSSPPATAGSPRAPRNCGDSCWSSSVASWHSSVPIICAG
eukprot:264664-Pyramimonas_sp.AAC.1